MTKAEAIAYLRKKQLLDKIADQSPVPNSEVAKELREMEKSSEEDLTNEKSSV